MRETSKQASEPAAHDRGLVIEGMPIMHLQAAGLSLQPGDCVSLAGASGTGKSLFLRALADLLPHEGRLLLDGVDCADLPATDWRRQVMLVPPEAAWWAARVADHFPDGRLPTAASRLNLPGDIGARDPASLSSGESQRLAFLRALARRPRVLLLDEPTANLDADNARHLEAVLCEWLAGGGMAVLVSHDETQRQRLCNRHWQIRDNRVEVA